MFILNKTKSKPFFYTHLLLKKNVYKHFAFFNHKPKGSKINFFKKKRKKGKKMRMEETDKNKRN